MKKLIILIIPILLLCGCEQIKNIKIDEKSNPSTLGEITTYCDKKYNVEYLIFFEGDKVGMTIRLDGNGNVIHCK